MLEFSPELVKVVDRVGPNTLIRGPMPLRADESFAYEDIAQATGLDLTQKTFVDISLIDCTGEHMFLAAEMAAFGLTAPEPSYWPPFLQPDYHPSKGTPSTLPGGHPATSQLRGVFLVVRFNAAFPKPVEEPGPNEGGKSPKGPRTDLDRLSDGDDIG